MIVKAKYKKEIEVIDEISEEEIGRICQYGMPDRFDCMADDIDNDQPLEFSSWSFVEDKYYEPNNQPKESDNTTERPKTNTNVLKWLFPIIFAIISGIVWGIIKYSFVFGLISTSIYVLAWIIATIMINWVEKVNKFMEKDK
jgi:hypothetical protein